jgi:hypothetical protein
MLLQARSDETLQGRQVCSAISDLTPRKGIGHGCPE